MTALDVVVGPEPTDLRSLPRPEASWLAALDDPHVPVRVAWSPTLGYANVDAEVLAACERAVGDLESLGAEVDGVDTVFESDPVGDWLTLIGGLPAAHHAALHGPSRAGSEVDPVLRAIVDARPSDHRRAGGAGVRPVPRDEPAPGRAVPRRCAS